jgi:hypothetical protein
LRRSYAAVDPQQAALVAQSVEGMREVWAQLGNYRDASDVWAAQNPKA